MRRRRTIRLITWNCSRGKYDEKRSKILSLDPDLVVFQEASQSNSLGCNDFWYGNNHKNGIAILADKKLKVKIGPVDKNAPWSIVPIIVYGKYSLHLLAVWTRADDKYIQSLDKALDIYSGFLRKAPSIILGDFNSNAIWDNPKKDTDFSRVAHRLLQEFGLKSAYHEYTNENYGSETCATHHFRWHKDEPFHIDYCFVPSSWNLQNVEVGQYDEWGTISDHCPLVIDIEIPPISVASGANLSDSERSTRSILQLPETYSEEEGMDFRIYRKILKMVAELHLRGYQRLRIAPGMSPSGCHWRCSVTPIINISKNHGARLASWTTPLSVNYTSGQGREYFGWKDASDSSPSHLADLFIKRFPKIAETGYGSDWQYAGWYLEMLHLTYPKSFPIAYADWDLPHDHLPGVGGHKKICIPLPPPGLGVEAESIK